MGSNPRWLVVVLVGMTVPGRAATFVVSTTTDAVDATPGDGVCADGTGACTLRAAVQEANATAGADRVELPAGVFRLSLAGASEDGGATGDLDVTEALEVVGAARDTTILDGLGIDRVLQASSGQRLALSRLTLRNGTAVSAPGGAVRYDGGGDLVLDDVSCMRSTASVGGCVSTTGTLTVTASVFTDVTADTGGAIAQSGSGAGTITGTRIEGARVNGAGGAIAFTSAGGLTVTDTTIGDVSASDGAGIFATPSANVSITGGSIERATATGGGAGAIRVNAPAGNVAITNLTIRDCFGGVGGAARLDLPAGTITLDGLVIERMTAQGPGGAFFLNTGAGHDVSVRNVTFADTVSTGSQGGAMYINSGGACTLERISSSGAAARSGAGAVFLVAQGDVRITDARVVGASGGFGAGGGMYVVTNGTGTIIRSEAANCTTHGDGGGMFVSSSGGVTIDNASFGENLAAGATVRGGGLFVQTSYLEIRNTTISGNTSGGQGGGLWATTAFLANVTFTGNAASSGASVWNGGTMTLINTILAATALSDACAGSEFTSGGSNIDAGTSCGLAGLNDRSALDPLLGPLADNGGPTRTHLPQPGSPAIDAGVRSACGTADQRGQARPTDGNGDGISACDIGAAEYVPPPPDGCPDDPAKTAPGVCGCGVPDDDTNEANGVADCLVVPELRARIERARALLNQLDGSRDAAQESVRSELRTIGDGLEPYLRTHEGAIGARAPKPPLAKLAKLARAKMIAATAKRGRSVKRASKRALAVLDGLDGQIAP